MKIGVIAIHGGNIEPLTDTIAREIAGDFLPLYINTEGNHIKSIDFTNKALEDFISEKDTLISIHGQKDTVESFVMIGGLDKELKSKIGSKLRENFEIKNPSENLDGNSSENICNKGKSGKGVQLEISRKLRNELIENPEKMSLFTTSIRSVLLSQASV